MRYFLDTEFIEAPQHLELISIGIVSEAGETLYMESHGVNWARASQWVIDNVKPHLSIDADIMGYTRARMRTEIREFVGDDPAPEFWGYYCDYDWVALLCWLFGTMMDLPKGFPYLCRDLRQALDERGLQHIKQPDDAPHHALSDAQWIAATHAAHIGPNATEDAA
jgi:hypothetical protein